MSSTAAVAREPGLVASRPVRAEAWATLQLAGPLAATQLAQMAINTTDVLLLGWLGPEPLAAASLGFALYYFLFMGGVGVVQATSPLIAQAIGAGQHRRARRVTQQGVLVVLGVSLPLMLVTSQGASILALLGQDPELLEHTHRFLLAMLWGLPGMLGAVFLRCFTSAFGTGRPVLMATLATLPLNALLACGLIFGRLGMPELGIVGSGVAAAVSHSFMALFLIVWCLRVGRFRRHLVPFRPWPDPALIGEILKVGLPIGVALLMESGLFSAAGLLMGLLGAISLAAHQVTLQICATFFMIPLGIGFAATVRVGLAHGAGDRVAARRAGLVACGLGSGFMLMTAALFWLAGPLLVSLFLDRSSAEALATASLAIMLLKIAALFQLFDGLQVVGISSLRGLGDTRIPMWLAAFGYWAIGIPTSALLSQALDLGPPGVWLGITVALAVVAVMMLRRFDRLTAPLSDRRRA